MLKNAHLLRYPAASSSWRHGKSRYEVFKKDFEL